MDAVWDVSGKYYFSSDYGSNFFWCSFSNWFILRLFGKDVMLLKMNNKKTYWINKDNLDKDMKNQF